MHRTSSMTSVQIVLRKSASCETHSTVPLNDFAKWSSSHSTAFKSKWLVGSSSKSTAGSRNNARARDTLILHPPLNVVVPPFCMACCWKAIRCHHIGARAHVSIIGGCSLWPTRANHRLGCRASTRVHRVKTEHQWDRGFNIIHHCKAEA